MERLEKTDRRTFMRQGAMGAGAMWMFSLQELAARGPAPRLGDRDWSQSVRPH